MADERVEQHGQQPEQGDGGHGKAHLLLVGFEDGGGGDDGGVAANGGADADQRGQFGRDFEQPPGQPGQCQRGADADDDQHERGQPGGGDILEAETQPEQDDAEPQQPLEREFGPGVDFLAEREGVANVESQ